VPAGVLVLAPATFQIQFAPASGGTGRPAVRFWAATVLLVPAVPTEVYRDVFLARAGIDVDLATDGQAGDAGELDVGVTRERGVEEPRGGRGRSDRTHGPDLARPGRVEHEPLPGGEARDAGHLEVGRSGQGPDRPRSSPDRPGADRCDGGVLGIDDQRSADGVAGGAGDADVGVAGAGRQDQCRTGRAAEPTAVTVRVSASIVIGEPT
jgi:hypothetical protein